MNKKAVVDCQILENVLLGNDIFKMVVDAPAICQSAQPGQFVQVKTGRKDSHLLRRPISIADADGDKLTIIYRIVGEGTKWLSECKTGETANIMGPLGRGFDLSAQRPLLTGGGVGIAPMIFLARALCASKPVLLLAARCKADVVFWQELFSSYCPGIHVTTDDGSLGTKGNVMALLPELCAKDNFDRIYACGPTPMLRAIAKYSLETNVPCQVSLESHMACGLGVCLACACNSADKSKRLKICQNGPVFEAGEVEGL